MMQSLLSVFNHYLHRIPADWQAGMIALLIFLLFLLLGKVLSIIIIKLVVKFTSHDPGNLKSNSAALSFQGPLRYFIITLGTYWALQYLPLTPIQDVFIGKMFRSVVIILVAWGFYELVGIQSSIAGGIKARLKMDDILIAFFSKIIRFVIVSLAVVLCASEWDYDVNGFIAGLGLGGLAFALAAKDALANIFGGIIIIMEKPFAIGDWVATPSVEGIVETISFRSTRFRTFTQALVTVPNSTLANEAITNWSRMGKRRVSFYLGLNYATPPDKIEIAVGRIKQLLRDHQEIHDENILVSFEKFQESSLDILIQYFTQSTVWKDNLKVREEVNLGIMRLLAEEGINTAFPNRSIFIAGSNDSR